MLAFIVEHGPNDWNFLPEEAVRRHLQDVANGAVSALLALAGDELRRFVTFHPSQAFEQYQRSKDGRHAYIAEAVVHRAETGRGLGTRLLRAAIERLAPTGCRTSFRRVSNGSDAGAWGFQNRAKRCRYSAGVIPVRSLNVRRRLESLLKPSSSLMDLIGAEVSVSRSLTWLSLIRRA